MGVSRWPYRPAAHLGDLKKRPQLDQRVLKKVGLQLPWFGPVIIGAVVDVDDPEGVGRQLAHEGHHALHGFDGKHQGIAREQQRPDAENEDGKRGQCTADTSIRRCF